MLVACSEDLIGLRDKVLVSVGSTPSADAVNSWRSGSRTSLRLMTAGTPCWYVVPRTTRQGLGGRAGSHLPRVVWSVSGSLLIGTAQGPLLRPVYGKRALGRYCTLSGGTGFSGSRWEEAGTGEKRWALAASTGPT